MKRSQLKRFRHLVRMPPGRLPLEVFRPRGRPRPLWRDIYPIWPGNALGPPGGAGEGCLGFSPGPVASNLTSDQLSVISLRSLQE